MKFEDNQLLTIDLQLPNNDSFWRRLDPAPT